MAKYTTGIATWQNQTLTHKKSAKNIALVLSSVSMMGQCFLYNRKVYPLGPDRQIQAENGDLAIPIRYNSGGESTDGVDYSW